MITTEKVFDMLPSAVDIFEKLDLKEFYTKNSINIAGKNKDEVTKLQKEIGMKIILYISKNCFKVKEEIFQLLAIFNDMNMEDIKAQPILETWSQFKEILDNKEIMDFFKSAIQ